MLTLLMLLLHGIVFSMPWRGITPLRSTREDVEKILHITSKAGQRDELTIGNQLILITYNEQTCPPTGKAKWDIPVDTVISIWVIPQSGHLVLFSGLNLDLTAFTAKGTDVSDLVEYTDRKGGFSIVADVVQDRVSSFSYFETEEDSIAKRCPNRASLVTPQIRQFWNFSTSFTERGTYGVRWPMMIFPLVTQRTHSDAIYSSSGAMTMVRGSSPKVVSLQRGKALLGRRTSGKAASFVKLYQADMRGSARRPVGACSARGSHPARCAGLSYSAPLGQRRRVFKIHWG